MLSAPSPSLGQIETANENLQDRLAKAIQLARSYDYAQVDAILAKYILFCNLKFTVQRASLVDSYELFRPENDLVLIVARWVKREL